MFFSALFRAPQEGRPAEAVLLDEESSCFYHPQKRAAAPCTECGRFLCALCIVALTTLLVLLGIVAGWFGLLGPGFAIALVTLLYFAVTNSYGIFLEWAWRGQTIGKRLLRLRVGDLCRCRQRSEYKLQLGRFAHHGSKLKVVLRARAVRHANYILDPGGTKMILPCTILPSIMAAERN